MLGLTILPIATLFLVLMYLNVRHSKNYSEDYKKTFGIIILVWMFVVLMVMASYFYIDYQDFKEDRKKLEEWKEQLKMVERTREENRKIMVAMSKKIIESQEEIEKLQNLMSQIKLDLTIEK